MSPGPKMTRVILADDHGLVRAGLRRLLEGFGGIEVVGETGDGLAALELAELHHPDVLIADIMMPRLNGLELAAEMSRRWPHIGVLILSMHVNEECVGQALRCGAKGYLVKDSAACELELAVRAVARDEMYLSPAVSKHVVAKYIEPPAGRHGGLEGLSPRHRQVLQLVAEGHTTKEIARLLKLSTKTVENHRGQLMRRLDIHDIAGLARYAIRVGLVSADQRA
jgi:DNA-binding NarL/FixJ family response regulator